MAQVILGNHSAVRVRGSDREAIRSFYCGVLGCRLVREFDTKDDLVLGNDFFIAFLYATGDGQGADRGANYASDNPLTEQEFLKAIFLELKTNDVKGMRQKIVSSGVKVLEVPDPHLYFQAPGGQVFRLVGINEDLSKYEEG